MDRIATMTDIRTQGAALIRDAEAAPVFIVRHGRPVAVLLSAEVYERTLDRIEDLEDRLAVWQARGDSTITLEDVERALAAGDARALSA